MKETTAKRTILIEWEDIPASVWDAIGEDGIWEMTEAKITEDGIEVTLDPAEKELPEIVSENILPGKTQT